MAAESAVFFLFIFIVFIAIVWKFLPASKRQYSVKNNKVKTLDDVFSPRRHFDSTQKYYVLKAQGHKCNVCKCGLLGQGITEFDHIDGNRSNDSTENCQALCANCHRRKTNEENKFRRTGI